MAASGERSTGSISAIRQLLGQGETVSVSVALCAVAVVGADRALPQGAPGGIQLTPGFQRPPMPGFQPRPATPPPTQRFQVYIKPGGALTPPPTAAPTGVLASPPNGGLSGATGATTRDVGMIVGPTSNVGSSGNNARPQSTLPAAAKWGGSSSGSGAAGGGSSYASGVGGGSSSGSGAARPARYYAPASHNCALPSPDAGRPGSVSPTCACGRYPYPPCNKVTPR